jgi:hypothetical protein
MTSTTVGLTVACLTVALAEVSCRESAGPSEDETVRDARVTFDRVNRDQRRYRQIERSVTGLSAEGAAVVGYCSGSELAKIHVTWFGETGKTVEEYYFERSKPVLLYSSALHYDRPYGRVVQRWEQRYYFKDWRLARWVDSTGRRVSPQTAKFSTRNGTALVALPYLFRALAGRDTLFEVFESKPPDRVTPSMLIAEPKPCR